MSIPSGDWHNTLRVFYTRTYVHIDGYRRKYVHVDGGCGLSSSVTLRMYCIDESMYMSSASQWRRGLRRGNAAACMLGLRVRIPLGAWMSVVSVVCFQVEVSESGWSLVQRRPTDCGVSECDLEALTTRRPWPTKGCRTVGGKKYVSGPMWITRLVKRESVIGESIHISSPSDADAICCLENVLYRSKCPLVEAAW
jgi:hypothetical protein